MGLNRVQRASAATQAEIDRIYAGPLADDLRAWARRRFRNRSSREIDDALREAVARTMLGCEQHDPHRVQAYMWRAMSSVLTDEARAHAREEVRPDHAPVFQMADPESDPQRMLERSETRAELEELFTLVVRTLEPRQALVLGLYARGMRRRALADELGVSERIVKRDLQLALDRARDLLVQRCGGGCAHGTGLVARFAFGLARDNEAAQAQLHVTSCSRCQTLIARLDPWREAAAAAIPIPAAHQLDPAVAEGVLNKATEALASAKQQLVDAASQAKQHAAATYTRAVEYTPLASVRPGAAAGVVAGCLALGGGAAGYCVDQGVNPITGLVDALPKPATQHERVAQKTPKAKPASEQPPDSAPSAGRAAADTRANADSAGRAPAHTHTRAKPGSAANTAPSCDAE